MLDTIKKSVISAIVFLFPLFFLPFTQEYYLTNKLYLLAFGTLLLLAIVIVNFVIGKHIVLRKTPFDGVIFLLLVISTISLILMSPNPVQGLLNPVTGLAVLYSLSIFYFIVTQSAEHHKEQLNSLIHSWLSYGAVVLSIVTLIFVFNPFKNAKLPLNLQFLTNPFFTPMGITLDAAIFLGFFLVQAVVMAALYKKHHQHAEEKKSYTKNVVILGLIAVALAASIYTLIKPIPGSNPKTSLISSMPPVETSWYTAIDTLKKPLTALFGVGADNYVSAWTQSKTATYNQSVIWQTNFDRANSYFLHIITETGLLGFIAFVLIIVYAFKAIRNINENEGIKKYLLSSLIYLVLVMTLFPASLPVLFLFFILLIQIALSQPVSNKETNLDLSSVVPVSIGIAILGFFFIAVAGYFLGRTYVAEFYFKKSLNSFAANNARDTYLYQQKAIVTNERIERFRVNFSQLNMLLANNLAAQKKDKLSDEDKQNINQAIQAAISEGKAAVSLNPQKASNWENLAIIYRNILNVAQGADTWTVSAYQRAVLLDPVNPALRLNLGGVFYSLTQYGEAAKAFEQATALKPDWSNAHYNLAWASYQNKDYKRAVQEMQNVLVLIKDTKSDDYKVAQKDLAEFKKNMPEDSTQPEATTSGKPKELGIPTPPPQQISPKLELPKESSPEANPQ